jgi:DNA replicative helicase MCM subunit Mcm2 (Cdc46/Mcm family)
VRLYHIKLSILLSIFSSTSTTNSPSLIHLLIVGDPGVGKSSLIREAVRLHPKGILQKTISSTKPNLTLAVVKEENDLMLEAGSLILSDQGVLGIDDVNLLHKNGLEEVMEAMRN